MGQQQQGSQPSPTKVERKIVEKNRRSQMKNLYSELNSLLPTRNPKVCSLSLPPYIYISCMEGNHA